MFVVSKNMEIYANLYKVLNRSYVDEVEAAGLMRIGLNGMLKKLDPYTNYITEAQIEDAKMKRFAAGGDVGATVLEKDGRYFIEQIVEHNAAYEAGLKAGDEILSIDGKTLNDKSLDDVTTALKGQEGSELTLEVKSFADQNTGDYKLVRQAVKPVDVTFYKAINDTIGYIRLSSFTQRCGEYVADALMELKTKNDIKHCILDLRFNGGGLLKEAILVSNIFVNQGELVVSTKGKIPDWDKDYRAPQGAIDLDIPLAVLTNKRSASASEIVSGVMQDLDRGVVIGQRTFGKGLVQQTRDIGFNSKVKLTVAKYYLPSGRCIQAVDYYGQYTDQGAVKIPDSLRNEFFTRNQRKVYDNGGVKPDLEVDTKEVSIFVKNLKDQHKIFDFVNQYCMKQDSIADPLDFKIDAALLSEFRSFLLAQDNFTLDSKTQDHINDLKESLKKEKYDDETQGLLKAMEDKIKGLNASLVDKHENEIKEALRYSIIDRYHYEQGKVEASLDADPEINAALELFSDMGQYRTLLKQ